MSPLFGRMCRLHSRLSIATVFLAILSIAVGCGKSESLVAGSGSPRTASNFVDDGDWPTYGGDGAATRAFPGTMPLSGNPVGFWLNESNALPNGDLDATPVIGPVSTNPADGYNIYVIASTGSSTDLLCYSAATLRYKWGRNIGFAGNKQSPVVDSVGNVFYVAEDKVLALDSDGNYLWGVVPILDSGDAVVGRTSMAIMEHGSDEWLIVAAGDSLYAFDTADGSGEAQYDIADSGTWRYIGSPAIDPIGYPNWDSPGHLVYIARLRTDGDGLKLTSVDLDDPDEVDTFDFQITDSDEYDLEPIHYQAVLETDNADAGPKGPYQIRYLLHLWFATNDGIYGFDHNLVELNGWPISGNFTGSPALLDNHYGGEDRLIATEVVSGQSIVHAFPTYGNDADYSDWDSDPVDLVAVGSPAIDSEGNILINYGTGDETIGSMQFYKVEVVSPHPTLDYEWSMHSLAAPFDTVSLLADPMVAQPDDGTGIMICAVGDDNRIHAKSFGSTTSVVTNVRWPMASFDNINSRRSPFNGPYSGISIDYSTEVSAVLGGSGAIGYTQTTNGSVLSETSDEQVYVMGGGNVYRFDTTSDEEGCLEAKLALSEEFAGSGSSSVYGSPAIYSEPIFASGNSLEPWGTNLTTGSSFSSAVFYPFGGTDYVVVAADDRVNIVNRANGGVVASTPAINSTVGYITANPVVMTIPDNSMPAQTRMVIFVLLREPVSQLPFTEFNVRGYAFNGTSTLVEVYNYNNLVGDFASSAPQEWGLTLATVLVTSGMVSTYKTFLLSTTRSKVQAFTFPTPLNLGSSQALTAAWSFNPTGTFHFGGPGALWTDGTGTNAKLYCGGAEGGVSAQVLALDVAQGGMGGALAWSTAQIFGQTYSTGGYPVLDNTGYLYIASDDELHIFDTGGSTNQSPIYDSGDLGRVVGSVSLGSSGFVYLPIEGSTSGTGKVACFYDP